MVPFTATHVRTSVRLVVVFALALVAAPAFGQATTARLKRASLDDLMQMEVTSVSKKEQKLSEAASAIFVLTQEDLQRAGVSTIADALRLVPGVHVARIDANKWAISSRGFSGRFANKMLVLIDGRSVYTPLFSGVYWDVQDTALSDVDRIEIIRGPGATLWGANAVNGVINIITLSARASQGGQVMVRSGGEEAAVVEARYGDTLGDGNYYRAFVKYFDRGPFQDAAGSDTFDGSNQVRAGFRFERQLPSSAELMLDVQAYGGRSRTNFGPGAVLPFFLAPVTSQADLSGGHALGRWTRTVSATNDFSVQAYFDHTSRRDPTLDEHRDTFDVEFQHHTVLAARHDVVWGAGFRATSDELVGSPFIQFRDPSRTDTLLNMFVQDDVEIVPDRLQVTGGLKLERNDYTGWEWQPSARAIVMLDGGQSLWAAVSRAVRTPSRADSDVLIQTPAMFAPEGFPFFASLSGTPAFRSEVLRSHEIGYRVQPLPQFSFDFAAFVNVYDHLRSVDSLAPVPALTPLGPGLHMPLVFANGLEADARGFEAVARWDPTAAWRVEATYSFLDTAFRRKGDRAAAIADNVEDATPRHLARVRVGYTRGRLEVDGAALFVGGVPQWGIDRYEQVDARLGWRLTPDLLAEIGGRNLTNSRHVEFISTLGEVPTQTPRSVFAGLRWAF